MCGRQYTDYCVLYHLNQNMLRSTERCFTKFLTVSQCCTNKQITRVKQDTLNIEYKYYNYTNLSGGGPPWPGGQNAMIKKHK